MRWNAMSVLVVLTLTACVVFLIFSFKEVLDDEMPSWWTWSRCNSLDLAQDVSWPMIQLDRAWFTIQHRIHWFNWLSPCPETCHSLHVGQTSLFRWSGL